MFRLKKGTKIPCYAWKAGEADTIPFRLLSFKEYKDISLYIEDDDPGPSVEDHIFDTCVIDERYTQLRDALPAGFVSVIARLILKLSGPEEIEVDMATARQGAEFIDNYITQIICGVFQAYKPEEVDDLDYRTKMLRFAQAEKLLLETGARQEPFKFTKRKQQGPWINFEEENREINQYIPEGEKGVKSSFNNRKQALRFLAGGE